MAPLASRASRSSAVAADSRVAGIVAVAADAIDVGQVHQLGGADRLGDGSGDGVGVDVVGLPGGVAADGGDDRDEVLGQQALDQVGVDGSHVADEAELGVAGLGADEPGVLARDSPTASGACTLMADDDVAVDLADEHHAGDVERLGVGDPQSVDELRHLAQPGHELADLRARRRARRAGACRPSA